MGIRRKLNHFLLESSTIHFFRPLLFQIPKTTPESYLARLVVSITKAIQALSLMLSRLGLRLLGLIPYRPSVTNHSVSPPLLLKLLITLAILDQFVELQKYHLD